MEPTLVAPTFAEQSTGTLLESDESTLDPISSLALPEEEPAEPEPIDLTASEADQVEPDEPTAVDVSSTPDPVEPAEPEPIDLTASAVEPAEPDEPVPYDPTASAAVPDEPEPYEPEPIDLTASEAEPEPDSDFEYDYAQAEQDEELLHAIQRFAYKTEDSLTFKTPKEAVTWWENSRRWAQSNTYSTLKELNYAKSGVGWSDGDVTDADIEDLRVIRDRWDKIPSAFARIGKGDVLDGMSAIGGNLARGILDPSILLGGFAGRTVGAVTGRVLTKMQNAAAGAAVDSAITAGADVAYQQTNVDINLQKGINGFSVIAAGVLGGALSFPGHYFFGKRPTTIQEDMELLVRQSEAGSEEMVARGLATAEEGLHGSDKNRVALSIMDEDTTASLKQADDAAGDASAAPAARQADDGEVVVDDDPTGWVSLTEEVSVTTDTNVLDLAESHWLRQVFDDGSAIYGSKYYDTHTAFAATADSAEGGAVNGKRISGKDAWEDLWMLRVEDDGVEGAGAASVEAWGTRIDNMVVEVTDALDALGTPRPAIVKGTGRQTEGSLLDQAKTVVKGKDAVVEGQKIIDTPQGFVENATGILARKMILAKMQVDYKKTARRIASGEKLTPEEAVRFENMTRIMPAAEFHMVGMASETGRALRALQIQVGPTTVSGLFKKTAKYIARGGKKAPSDTLKVNGKNGKYIDHRTGKAISEKEYIELQQEVAGAIMRLDPRNALQLDLFHSNLVKGNGRDMFWELFYNSLLSSPSTHLINLGGNTATGLLDGIETAGAKQLLKLTKEGGLNTGGSVYRAKKYGTSFITAFKTAAKVWRTELPTDPKTRMEMDLKRATPSYVWDETIESPWKLRKAGIGEGLGLMPLVNAGPLKKGAIGGRQLRYAGRLLISADDFFKSIHFDNELHILAAQVVKKNADEAGEVLSDAVVQQRIDTIVKNAPTELLEDARLASQVLTFTDDTKLSSGISKGVSELTPYETGRLVVPFVRTPLNIVAYGLGMIYPKTPKNKAAWAAGGLEKEKVKVRMAVGWSLMGAALALEENGLITGPSPADPGQRSVFEAAKKLPYAAKIGGQWVQWNRFDPIAIPFAVASSLPEIVRTAKDDGEAMRWVTGFVTLFSESMLEKTWFQGMQNVVTAITEPERDVQQMVNSIVRMAVPSVVSGVVRAADPRVLAPRTLMSILRDRSGANRDKVPPKVDILGSPVTVETVGVTAEEEGLAAWAGRLISPLRAQTISTDPEKAFVVAELENLRVSISKPKRTWKGVKLNEHQYHTLSKARGETLYNTLNFAMSQPGWKEMGKVEKRAMIAEARKYATEQANNMLTIRHGDVARKAASPEVKFKKLLAPTTEELNAMPLPPIFDR